MEAFLFCGSFFFCKILKIILEITLPISLKGRQESGINIFERFPFPGKGREVCGF